MHTSTRCAPVWLLPLLATAAQAADGVAIRKADPARLLPDEAARPVYTVSARTYRAEVYPSGRVGIFSGQTELIRELVVQVGRDVKALGRIRTQGDDRIVLQEGAAANGAPAAAPPAAVKDAKPPDLPGVSLRFLPDRIEIEPTGAAARRKDAKAPARAIAISGLFGDDAIAVKDLKSGRDDALPARYMCSRHIFSFYGWYGHYWPEIAVTYRDGARLEVRGVTGVSHYAIGRRDPYTHEKLKAKRGFWQLAEADQDSRITLAVEPADAARRLEPAPYCTLRPDKPRGLFYEHEPVAFHLDFAEGYLAGGTWRLQWTLEDHRQQPAGEGEQELVLSASKQPPVAITITPKQMGCFRARLSLARPDGRSARRMHEVAFARIRPEAPHLRDLDEQSGVDGEMLWANILGMRGIRLNPSWSDNFRRHGRPDGTIDWAAWRERFEAYLAPARKGTLKGLFSFTGLNWSADLAKWFEKQYGDPKLRQEKIAEAKRRYLTEYAREAAKLGVSAWEPVNEPNLSMSQEKYIQEVLKPQYAAVKAGNPKANFLGGSICGLDNHRWVRRLYQLGGQALFDGISLHPYTGLGFQEAYRAELDQWRQILRDFGDTGQGIWMTESAWHRGWAFNDYVYDRFGAFRQSQARNAVLMHLHAEAMAIPRQRIYVFYLVEHGYNDFYLVTRQHATAAAVAIQVMNECLRDAAFVREVPLPGSGHHFQLYRDQGRTVAAAFTAGEEAKLDLATDAKAVVVTDLMGNRRTIAPTGGRFHITMSGDPTYMQVTPGEMIRPVFEHLRVQPNLAIPTLGAGAAASSLAKPAKGKLPLPPSAAICGDWTCYAGCGAWNGARRGWDEDDANRTFPDFFEVKLGEPAEVARIRIYHDYGAWERLLRDYDVQVHTAGEWKTVASVRGNRYGFVHDHRFAPVKTDRVRLLIHDVNACLFESMTWIPKLSTLRAVEVFAAPGGPAKAFFVQEIPRRRLVAPGGEVDLRFAIRNARSERLTGEVRLRLPTGLAAEPAARRLTLPPDGEAACSFKIRLDSDAAPGLHTVLAGFHDGAALISSDCAARVLCCQPPTPAK